MSAIQVPAAPVVLSTASVLPEKTPEAFEIASRLGYDGVEVLVYSDPVSQDVDMLRRLSDYHHMPILAVHAPCLIFTQRVWGRDPWGKLVRSKEMAEALGVTTVVVHPPFRWQRDYAREFETGIQRMREETDVVFAVENMYPVRMRGREVVPYAPTWNPVERDYPDVTLDLSHAAMSGSNAMDMAKQLGDRLSHVHLADGVGGQNLDEHLIPGRGSQPCAELLEQLATSGYDRQLVLEVNTRKAPNRQARELELAEALAYTRLHFAGACATPGRRASAGERTAAESGHDGYASRRERTTLRGRTGETPARVWVATADGTVADGE